MSSLQNERFVRDFLRNSCVNPPKRALRARLPQKLTLRVCKTSVSYETSSKTNASSLQNERFVRDFLQKSRRESAKRAFRTRLPPKVACPVSKTRFSYETFLRKSHVKVSKTSISFETSSKSQAGTPIGAHTHIKQHCQAVSRFQPLQPTPARTPIPMSQRHSPPPQLATSRFPAPATKLSVSTRLTRTKYCTCHEMSPPSHLATSRSPAPAMKIALLHLKTRTKYCACHEK